MATEIKKEIKLEIGHVLFMDIVRYSTRLINDQRALRSALNEIVRQTEQFREADAAGTLIKSPTGDGMALVFHGSLEEPVECAMEISRALKAHPELPLRMGVHSGPVTAVVDVNDTTSVAGAGINMAQRVMDCGDAGHILLSKHVAEDLEHYGHWQPCLHSLGECEVKHGVRVHLVNLYADKVGNPQLPKKFYALKRHKARMHWAKATAVLLVVAAIVALVIWQLRGRAEMKAEIGRLRQGIMNYPHMDAEVRGSRTENNPAAVQEQIYAELGKQLGVDPKVLREKLPQVADQLKQSPNAGAYERANASYVAKDYAEAERLALQAAHPARTGAPVNSKNLLA